MNSRETDCTLDCAPVDGSCGDTLCLPPENSTSCLQDCPAEGGGMGAVCGDNVCDGAVENQLSCAEDCWPAGANIIACIDASCEGLLDACADEDECVDLAVCAGPCIVQNNPVDQCISNCEGMAMPTQDNLDAANSLLSCAQMAGCL